MAEHMHVVFVPEGRGADDVWAEICTMGHLVETPWADNPGEWATIRCDGQECMSIEWVD